MFYIPTPMSNFTFKFILKFFIQSVIVERSNYETYAQEPEDILILSLDMKRLEDLYHQEEGNYVDFLHEKFYQIWNDVSLGETIIRQHVRLLNAQSNTVLNEMSGMVQLIPYVDMQTRYVSSFK